VVYATQVELHGATHEAALARVEGIGDTLRRLMAAASANGTTPAFEAGELARSRLLT
jgi:hypothetical protein